MVNCPRCDFAVDETTRTTCPLCFTPLNLEGATETTSALESAAAATIPETLSVPEPPQVAASAVGQAPVVPVVPPASVIPIPPQQAQSQPQVPVMPPPVIPQMPPQQQQMQQGGMPQPQAVPQAPQYAPGSTPRPGVRVSLMGEVIEEAVPAAPPPNYGGGGAMPPLPTAQAPAAKGRRNNHEEAPGTTQGNTVNAVILSVILLLVVGWGGWRYFSSRTNPKDQTTKFLTAFKEQDWQTLYTVIDLSDDDKKRLPDAVAFEKDAKEKISGNPQLSALLKDLKFTVGEPKVEGETASVPVTLGLKIQGQEMSLPVNTELVNKGGWKVKPSAAISEITGGMIR